MRSCASCRNTCARGSPRTGIRAGCGSSPNCRCPQRAMSSASRCARAIHAGREAGRRCIEHGYSRERQARRTGRETWPVVCSLPCVQVSAYATGPRLLKKHFHIATTAFGTRTGRVITLVLLVVGGGLSFGAWLQTTELKPALHPHATASGGVSRSSDAVTTIPAESHVSNTVQSSEVVDAPAPEPMRAPVDISTLPRVREVAKSAPRPAQMEPPPGVPSQPSKAESKTEQQPPRQPSFMSTFAHH